VNETLAAGLLAAVLCGLGGLAVPALIGRIPEPDAPDGAPGDEPDDEPGEADVSGTDEADADPDEADTEPPKEPYAAIAALPRLRTGSALASAGIGGLVGASTGLDWSLLWWVPLVPVGVALAVIDWRTRLLPRLVVLPATLIAVLLVVAVGLATGAQDALVRALVGMVATRSFFWVLWFLRSAGMGFGDVRLAAIVGLVLGWVGWGALVIGVWTGFLVFVVPGVALAVVRRDRSLMRKPFPYGPSMLVGAVVGLAWGTAIAGRIWG
jgi:leader peptidase (prepilin peptidase) / N-methyltransferase